MAKRHHNGGTFNLRVMRDDQTVKNEVIRIMKKHNLHYLCVQEAEEYRDELRSIPGFQYITSNLKEAAGRGTEVGILVRDGVKVTRVGTKAFGDGWWSAWNPGKRMKPREFLRMTLDRWERVGVIHNTPGITLHPDGTVTPKDRGNDYIPMMQAVERFLKRHGNRVVWGDWNVSSGNTTPMSPRSVANRVKAKVYSPDRGIDYALARKAVIQGINKDKEIREGSDHDLVVGRVVEG